MSRDRESHLCVATAHTRACLEEIRNSTNNAVLFKMNFHPEGRGKIPVRHASVLKKRKENVWFPTTNAISSQPSTFGPCSDNQWRQPTPSKHDSTRVSTQLQIVYVLRAGGRLYKPPIQG